MPNIYCCIPCNLDSKRLPNKPLLEKNGRTILEHTYELASQIRCLTQPPIVLFDNVSVYDKIKHVLKRLPNYDEINGMTTGSKDNGTLRCAYAACSDEFNMQDDDIIINVQVDEVEFNPDAISEGVGLFLNKKQVLGTFCYQKEDTVEYGRDHVKASLSLVGEVVYFSREDISEDIHVGIYVYTVKALKIYNEVYRFTKRIIQRENLEQMLFFEIGEIFQSYPIPPTISINTEDDYNEWLRR